MQRSQLAADLSASSQAGVVWQVLGNTVVMGPLNTPDVESAAQRQGPEEQTLLQNATNPVVLSGDIHNAFVWRLFRDNATTPVGLVCHIDTEIAHQQAVANSRHVSSYAASPQMAGM